MAGERATGESAPGATARPGRRTVGVLLADSTGGIAAHVGSVVPRVLAGGFDVHLLAPDAVLRWLVPASQPGAPPGQLTSAPVVIPGSPWASSLPARLLRHSPEPTLRRELAGVDLVHAHGLRAGRAALAARRPGTPAVVSWHNPSPTGGLAGLAARVAVRRLVRDTDITLGASLDLVEAARAAGARDARLCEVAAPETRQVVSSEQVAAVRSELEIGDRPLVVTAGRLTAQKDHTTLLAAAGLLAARTPAPLIAIAGAGPDHQALANRISELHLPVVLLGQRADVPTLLAAADVAVLTSRWEARALFAQQALRAGVPLVVTAVGGLPGLVGGAALTVAAGRPQQVADAIARILDLPGVAAGLRAAGPRMAARWPTESDTAAALRSVYAELLLLDS